MKRLLYLLFITAVLYSCGPASEFKLKSPDGLCFSQVKIADNNLLYSLIYHGDTIVRNAEIHLLEGNDTLLKNVTLLNIEESQTDETWNTVNGKNKLVRNNYCRYELSLRNKQGKNMKLEIRVYNQGFAYRFIVPKGSTGLTENSAIGFGCDFTFWAYNGENHNTGPVKLSEYGENTVLNPVVFRTSEGNYFALHEAAITEYSPFVLTNTTDNSFILSQECISGENGSVKTSWRAFILGDCAGDLIESDLLINLNEPCKIKDTSWIKPGKSMWDWRVWGYKADDGFVYGLNTVSHKRFIDFAAKNNIQYLLIDADWYGPEFSDSSDPTQAREGVNIEECMAYAKEKGVGVILYLNDVGAKKFGLERVLKQFAEWGAVGVKYGFMKGSPQEKVLNTRKIVELCAKYKLMVDFHDNPIAPGGDRRTWPNLVTKEFCHAQADAKRSYWPETIVTAPFVNMVAGPLDMTNGWFGLNKAFGNGRQRVFAEIPGTVVAEVAKLIVIYSGWTVLPDAPEEYLKKDDLFDCIRKMPLQFDSYKVLDGEIGKFITVARQAGDDWFVGSLTNRDGRELSVKFDFLDSNKKYVATFYEDAGDTHFEGNKEAYRVQKNIDVDSNTTVIAKLAPGGGQAIYIHQTE